MRYPHVDMEELTAIAVLAETGDFIKAGQLLNIGPSAVMKRLAKAERELQTRLFQRADAKLIPTEHGRIYIAEAQRALEHAIVAEEMVQAAKNLEEKRLRIGRSTHLSPRLLSVLARLDNEDIPGITLEQVSGLDHQIAQAVADCTLHAGVALLPTEIPQLTAIKLLEEPVVLCLPPGHPLATKVEIHSDDLDGLAIVAVGRNEIPSLHEEVEEFYHGFGIELEIVADAYTAGEALCLVEQRVGACFLSRSAASRSHSIVPKPLSSKILTRKSGIIFHEENQHPLIQSFVSLMKERIQMRSG